MNTTHQDGVPTQTGQIVHPAKQQLNGDDTFVEIRIQRHPRERRLLFVSCRGKPI